MPKFLHLLVAISAFSASLNAQGPIVLRDMSVLKNRSIAKFDADSVQLDDGKTLTWDQIHSTKSSDEKFNKWHSTLSLPLFRMKHRIDAGDFSGALEPANQLRQIFKNKQDTETFGLVAATQLAGRLQNAKRESALLALLEFLDSPLAKSDHSNSPFAKTLRRLNLKCDLQSGYCAHLLPIFFDAEAAKATLAALPTPKAKPKQFYFVYVAALAEAANDDKRKQSAIKSLTEQFPQSPWLALFRDSADFQGDLELPAHNKLRQQIPSLWAIRQYRVGVWQIANKSAEIQKQGAIHLLKIPALTDSRFQELSAASLHRVAIWYDKHNLANPSATLKSEILTRYPATQFGQKLSNKK